MRLDIETLGGWWGASVVFIVISIVWFGLAIVGVLILHTLPFVIFGFLAAFETVLAVQASRISDSSPVLVVEMGGLMVEHPAVLRMPLYIPRSQVHSVYLGPLDENMLPPRCRPPTGAGFKERLASRKASFSRRSVNRRFFTHIELAPDLSLGYSDQELNLMIVFDPPVAFGAVTRHLIGLRAFGRTRYMHPTFPSPRTNAHGVFMRLVDLDAARQAFASWPLYDEPAAEDLAWVGASR